MAPRKKQTKRKAGKPKPTRNNRIGRPPMMGAVVPQQRTGIRRMPPMPTGLGKMSTEGVAFLKCAFASPDFSTDPGKGIPDRYNGRTVSIKDCFTGNISVPAGEATFIAVAPVPGYAYFSSSSALPGPMINPILVGTPFPTADQWQKKNDANGNPFVNFSKFRYASLAAGIYPQMNLMQFNGSIQVWKTTMTLGTAVTSATTDNLGLQLSGLGDVAAASPPRDNYTESIIKGCYTIATDTSGLFEWSNFTYAATYSALANTAGDIALTEASTALPMPGFGNSETIIIRLFNSSTEPFDATIKVWNCIEAQVNTHSSFYQFSGTSPEVDPIALLAYNRIKNNLPVAVPCAGNAGFWKRVVEIIRSAIGGIKASGGAAGKIATGAEGILDAFGL